MKKLYTPMDFKPLPQLIDNQYTLNEGRFGGKYRSEKCQFTVLKVPYFNPKFTAKHLKGLKNPEIIFTKPFNTYFRSFNDLLGIKTVVLYYFL